MKWKTKLYSEGDERVVTRLLFLPKRIGEDVRWLELVKIRQEIVRSWEPPGVPGLRTVDLEFVDG